MCVWITEDKKEKHFISKSYYRDSSRPAGGQDHDPLCDMKLLFFTLFSFCTLKNFVNT